MVLRGMMRLGFCAVIFTAMCSLAAATPVEVGSGDNSAGLYIEWSDGFVAEFTVSFESATITGLEMFDIVEAGTSLTIVRIYGGEFIDGISYQGHTNSGYGGGEDWWHYWTMESGTTEWVSPWDYGAADRIVENGDCDGWIYGRAGEVPEPTTIALLAVGGLMLKRRKNRV